ncbi:hypothetical protein RJ639_027791 [Escallonia herrerae]|uniref:TIR domain-containing protein n=1 Tax=Escallonia herrerae TaxID=1293975 RepID=A0AA88X5K3_9ASTE|nr:hypothetical protein RJ639_027791 [Escallonia herrerae]
MGQTILPVFYHVEPSNVRRQEGLFGEGFPKQEDKVLKWKAALTEAGSISGWDLRNTANGHESKCIQQIVEVIMSKLGDTVSSDVDNLVGVGCRVEKMISLLAMGIEDVRIVGIWGVSGIGKTIIAKSKTDSEDLHGLMDQSTPPETTVNEAKPAVDNSRLSLTRPLRLIGRLVGWFERDNAEDPCSDSPRNATYYVVFREKYDDEQPIGRFPGTISVTAPSSISSCIAT